LGYTGRIKQKKTKNHETDHKPSAIDTKSKKVEGGENQRGPICDGGGSGRLVT